MSLYLIRGSVLVNRRLGMTSTEDPATVPTFQSVLLVTFNLVSTVLRARVDRSILKEMSPLQCLLATLMSSRITSCSEQVCRCDSIESTQKRSTLLTLVYFGDLLFGIMQGPVSSTPNTVMPTPPTNVRLPNTVISTSIRMGNIQKRIARKGAKL